MILTGLLPQLIRQKASRGQRTCLELLDIPPSAGIENVALLGQAYSTLVLLFMVMIMAIVVTLHDGPPLHAKQG